MYEKYKPKITVQQNMSFPPQINKTLFLHIEATDIDNFIIELHYPE